MKIGTTELIVIILIALVVFGPGKLPELGRMIGKAIGSIKHYSDPNTWEKQASAEEANLRKEEREAAEGASATGEGGGTVASGSSASDKVDKASPAEAASGSGSDAEKSGTSEAVSTDDNGQSTAGAAVSTGDDGQSTAGAADSTGSSDNAGSSDSTVPEDDLPIKIDVSAEISEEDAAHFSEMEGRSIDEIASSLLKASTRQDA